MITLLTAAAAWGCSSAPTSYASLQFPFSSGTATADTIVVVRQEGMDHPPELLDPSGEVVPAQIATHATEHGVYQVLLPLDRLAPGSHTVVLDPWGSTREFDVIDVDAGALDAPIPLVRTLSSELLYVDPPCATGEYVVSELSVSFCDRATLYAIAEGPGEPLPPSLDTPGDFWLFAHDKPDLAEVLGVQAGWAGTLWYGSFDAAGRFSGWTGPDPVQMPPVAYTIVESMPSAEVGDGYTPTTFSVCPPFGSWELLKELYCPTVDGSPDCAPPGEGPAGEGSTDTGIAGGTDAAVADDAPPEPQPDEGRGCSTVGAPAAPAGALFLAVFGLHRRGPRRPHTSQRSSR